MIRILTAADASNAIPDLSAILVDCVEGGASVGFMSPYSMAEAGVYWQSVVTAVENQELVLLVSEMDGRIVGTVQVTIKAMPNQPHRGDLKKLLVHSNARGLGLSRQLMETAEREAAARGKTLLVLDTATGEPSERIYKKFGWQRAGVIPDYALFPDGRYCDTTIFFKRLG